MMQKICLISATLILSLMSVTSVTHAESVQSIANKKSTEPTVSSLDGYWVDLTGRGVLTIEDDMATFSVDGEANVKDRYELVRSGQQLTLTPAPGSSEFNKPISTTLESDKDSIILKKGANRYEFVPAPNITPALLNGYWYEENMDKGYKHIRAMHYKNNGTVYDYYWWRVNQGYGTYQTHIDEDVPLEIRHGFILTAPGADNTFLVYATKKEDDTIHYVDSNGDKWTETKTDTLYKYTPPKGFREMKDWMTAQ